jgi:calcium-dependent protein kinase
MYSEMTGTMFYCAPEVFGDETRTGLTLKASDMWSYGVILFTMCTGSPPFQGKSDRAIMKAVTRGVYAWPDDLRVSAALKDLVARLLVRDPAARLTAVQARNHPWITGGHALSDVAFHPSVQATMAEFGRVSKMKRAFGRALTRRMSMEDQGAIATLFDQFDHDHDGKLDEVSRRSTFAFSLLRATLSFLFS